MKKPVLTPDELTTLLNNSDAGIVYYSCIRDDNQNIVDFRYEFINETAFRMIKRLQPEYIGTSVLSHHKNDGDFDWVEKFKETIETGEVINYIVKREEERERWFRNKLVKFRDGLIVYFYDDTEKLKISSELENTHNQLIRLLEKRNDIFSEVLNQAFDGVFFLMPSYDENNELGDFRIVFANEAALKSLNMTLDDIYPYTFLQVFPNAKQNGTFDMYKEAYEKGIPARKLVSYTDNRLGGWYRVDTFRYEEGVIVYFRDETLSVEHEKKIEQQNQDLKSLVKQKEILLQETHHRVKNNMQIVASLLNLQSSTITDPQILETFQVSVQRIQTMAIIHEKLYREKNFEKIHFVGFVGDVINSIKGFYNSSKFILFNYEIEDVDLPISTCINLGLVLNELISNSMKHAFLNQERGEISITSKSKGNQLEIIVSDNGIGLPPNMDLKNLASLGLTIVNVLVEQMSGTLLIENKKGVKFHITIPLK